VYGLPEQGIYLAPAERATVAAHDAAFRPNRYLTPMFP
jgi:hypothetical protein